MTRRSSRCIFSERHRIMLKRSFAPILLVIGVCSTTQISLAQPSGGASAKPQRPIAAEKNPPGDIPDNQAFVE